MVWHLVPNIQMLFPKERKKKEKKIRGKRKEHTRVTKKEKMKDKRMKRNNVL